jgi:hypothetical protein
LAEPHSCTPHSVGWSIVYILIPRSGHLSSQLLSQGDCFKPTSELGRLVQGCELGGEEGCALARKMISAVRTAGAPDLATDTYGAFFLLHVAEHAQDAQR